LKVVEVGCRVAAATRVFRDGWRGNCLQPITRIMLVPT
jgi:hypothetical protein